MERTINLNDPSDMHQLMTVKCMLVEARCLAMHRLTWTDNDQVQSYELLCGLRNAINANGVFGTAHYEPWVTDVVIHYTNRDETVQTAEQFWTEFQALPEIIGDYDLDVCHTRVDDLPGQDAHPIYRLQHILSHLIAGIDALIQPWSNSQMRSFMADMGINPNH
jgi:hypothetical protein